MNEADRKVLEKFALEGLAVTADEEERWSYLFRTEGSVGLLFCPWSTTEDWEFDGTVDDLDLPWSRSRLALIASGDADPNEEELRQWRRAMCHDMVGYADDLLPVWIVPVTAKRITGYALFLCLGETDGDEPVLEDIYESLDAAKAALTMMGAVRY